MRESIILWHRIYNIILSESALKPGITSYFGIVRVYKINVWKHEWMELDDFWYAFQHKGGSWINVCQPMPIMYMWHDFFHAWLSSSGMYFTEPLVLSLLLSVLFEPEFLVAHVMELRYPQTFDYSLACPTVLNCLGIDLLTAWVTHCSTFLRRGSPCPSEHPVPWAPASPSASPLTHPHMQETPLHPRAGLAQLTSPWQTSPEQNVSLFYQESVLH